MTDNPNLPVKDTEIVLQHDRGIEELKKDVLHFDPKDAALLLVYFTKEGENLKYYYRTYTIDRDTLWNGVGMGQPVPPVTAWDEPPDAIGVPFIDTTIYERPTKKARVNISSLNIRNSPSLNGNKQAATLRLNQVVEYYSDKTYPEPLNNTIVWVEVRTIDGKLPVNAAYKWVALKYLTTI